MKRRTRGVVSAVVIWTGAPGSRTRFALVGVPAVQRDVHDVVNRGVHVVLGRLKPAAEHAVGVDAASTSNAAHFATTVTLP